MEGEMRCIANMEKSEKSLVLAAAEAAGITVEWRDEPDHRMDGYMFRSDHGSVWADIDFATEQQFWDCYFDLQPAEAALPCN
jgi:hypothetical protein